MDEFEEAEIYERETLDQISSEAVPLALGACEMRRQDVRGVAPFPLVR